MPPGRSWRASHKSCAGQPLTVSLAVDGRPATIRLHYRNVDQTTAFRTIEGNGTFVISGADISARWI